jgi:hypothetical protein
MAHPFQNNQLRPRNRLRQILRMLLLNELITLTLHNHNRHLNPRQILHRIIRLRPLHQSQIIHQLPKLLGSTRQRRIILPMPRKAPLQSHRLLKRLRPTRIHIAGKEKHTRNPRWSYRRQHQSRTSTIAPPNHRSLFEPQLIHHSRHIARHQLIRKRPLIPRTPPMPTAINQNYLIPTLDQRRNLISPIPTMPQPAMQQNHRHPGPKRRIPDPHPVMLHISMLLSLRQSRSTVTLKPLKLIIPNIHLTPPHRTRYDASSRPKQRTALSSVAQWRDPRIVSLSLPLLLPLTHSPSIRNKPP